MAWALPGPGGPLRCSRLLAILGLCKVLRERFYLSLGLGLGLGVGLGLGLGLGLGGDPCAGGDDF